VSYGYDDEVMLLTEITPPRFLTLGQTVKFEAEAHWLGCEDICLPAMAELEFEIQISDEASAPSPQWREAFADTRRSLPVVAESWVMSATRFDEGFILEILTAHSAQPSFDGAFFYACERGVIAHGAQQKVTKADGGVRISLLRSPYARGETTRLRGVLVMPDAVEVGSVRARAVVVDVAVSGGSNSKDEHFDTTRSQIAEILR
jgi:thiol:disulfide interchange protein DsbD